MTKDTDIRISNWRKRWLRSINELTSIELQRNSWLNTSRKGPHYSYVEFVCSYFDDLNLDDNYSHQVKNNWISSEEVAVIIGWHQLLHSYRSPQGDYCVKEILEDKVWQDIVEIGRLAKMKLAELLNQEQQKILLKEVGY